LPTPVRASYADRADRPMQEPRNARKPSPRGDELLDDGLVI